MVYLNVFYFPTALLTLFLENQFFTDLENSVAFSYIHTCQKF